MNGAQIQWITAGALLLFAVLMISIGVISYRKAKTIDGFLLGGRNVGPIVSAFAYGTSYFSAVIFVGYAGKHGWDIGMSSMWIGVGNAVLGCLLAWCVLAKPTRRMTHRLKSKTMPEFFEGRYDSKALKIISALIIFIFLVPYSAAVYKGLGAMFNVIFPNISVNWCMFIIAALTAVYLVLGGYLATVYTDFVQGIIMIGGIALMIVSVLKYLGANGTDNVFEALAAIPMGEDGVSGAKLTSVWGGSSFKFLCTNILLTSFGVWGLPQMVQKFYTIRSETAIQTGMIVSTVFALIVAGGCYFLGGFGRLFSESIDVAVNGYDSIIPTMLSDLPDVLIALVIILVLSASMSTLSSLVIASSSTLTIDVIKDNIVADMSEKKQLTCIRFLIVVFIAVSVVIAIIQYKGNLSFIAQLMGISWGALAGSFLAPFLFALYWRKTSLAACWTCFLFGSGVMIANMLFPQLFPPLLQSPINAGAFVMLAGFVIVPVVSLLTPKPDPIFIRHAFACYEKKVEAAQKLTLGGK